MFCYQVAVNTPFNDSLLTYFSEIKYEEGTLVVLPLGKRKVTGCILEETKIPESDYKIKKVTDLYCETLKVPRPLLKLFKWTSKYYHYPLGKLIFDSLPKTMKRPRSVDPTSGVNSVLPALNDIQEDIYNKIKNDDNGYSSHLIHGVTGSGKSIIFLHLILDGIRKKQNVLYLLPEINLTPQFLKLFTDHLDCEIYTYNSEISASEKFFIWKRLIENDSKKSIVIIGVRSSVFLPMQNLGLIIVDEEHDQSFKQEDRCTYNARDLALVRGKLEDCKVVLGSATPSLESYTNFCDLKKGQYHVLKKRALNDNFPDIQIISEKDSKNMDIWPFVESSIKNVKERISNDDQVIVFANKLGHSSYIQCSHCSHQFECSNCSINLRYFKKRRELKCHQCLYVEKAPEVCPKCGCIDLFKVGFGTEKLEQVLKDVLEGKKITRFDRDEIRNFKDLNEKLVEINEKGTNVIVGTQMLSKGHNFKKVNCVIVLGIDASLNFPDFRAREKAYQQLTQIAGRAGRFGKHSDVIIQTLSPENKLFSYIRESSFDEFYKDEVDYRKDCEYPPFSKVACLYIISSKKSMTEESANNAANFLINLSDSHFKTVDILGPRPGVVEKRVNKFMWTIMIRSSDVNEMHNCIKTFRNFQKLNSSVQYKWDIDPYNMY